MLYKLIQMSCEAEHPSKDYYVCKYVGGSLEQFFYYQI